jgi:DNA-directed RNA polymerase subunit K/omega
MLMQRPFGVGAFQFVILSSLRAVQLTRGCLPRVDGVHKNTVIAQLEVSQGKVIQQPAPPELIGGAATMLAD